MPSSEDRAKTARGMGGRIARPVSDTGLVSILYDELVT